jgi:hypothetical protein
MAAVSEQRLFDALATVARAFADGGVPAMPGAEAAPDAAGAAADPSPAIAAMDDEAREVLGEAALAVAFGAFASRGGDGGPIHTLVAAMGLMAILAGRSRTRPPRSGASRRRTRGWRRRSTAPGKRWTGSSGATPRPRPCRRPGARILGTAVTLAGCTLPEGVDGQAAVRLRAARCLAKLSAGLMAMNAAGGASSGLPVAAAPGDAPKRPERACTARG